MPYLPLEVVNRADILKNMDKDRIFRAQDQNSVVTDLVDSPWSTWTGDEIQQESTPEEAELERIRSWASSLRLEREKQEDDGYDS